MKKIKLNQTQIELIQNEPDLYKKRDIVQDIGIPIFKESGFNLICTWATSIGKTIFACKIIKKVRENHNKEIHVCIPYDTLKEQWEKTLQSFNLDNVKVFIVNTYMKKDFTKEEPPFMLLADEVHRSLSNPEAIASCINDFPIKYRLYLSATLKQEQLRYLDSKGISTNFELTLKEALLLGMVPNFFIYNVFVDLTKEEQNKYKEAFLKYTEFFDFFKAYGYKNLPKLPPIIEGEDFEKVKILYFQAQGQRSKYMAILNNASNKIKLLKQINPYLGYRKTIFFSKSIKIAQQIAKLDSEMVCYHSNQSKGIGSLNLEKFKTNKTNKISSVAKLIAGFDDESSDTIFRHSFDSTQQAGIQSLGK